MIVVLATVVMYILRTYNRRIFVQLLVDIMLAVLSQLL